MVRIWESEEGLPGNVVRSIVQSPDGYLWVATAEGVARFDGTEFEPIEPPRPDGEGRNSHSAFWRLFATADGRIWVATFQGGLFRVAGSRLEPVLEEPSGSRPPTIGQLLTDAAGVVHFKRGEEILRFAGGGAPVVLSEPPADLLRRFADDERRQTAGGRAMNAGTPPRLDSRDGRHWTTDASGKLTVDDSRSGSRPVEIPGLPAGAACNELLEDYEGNVWIATPVNGLVRARPSRVEVLGIEEGLPDPTVLTLLQDHERAWWIGARHGGVERWTPQGSHHHDLAAGELQRPAAALFEDRSWQLWVASRGGSVFLSRNGGALEPQFLHSQTPSKVRAIAQDPAGLMWFGGAQGLASFDGTEVHRYGPAKGMPVTEVTVLAIDSRERVIAGTADGRIFRGGREGFQQVGNADASRSREISGLLPRADDELWATTLGDGLALWNGSQWRRFGEEDGLPDLRLTCILDDVRGQFWFGSLGGILRASRRELLARAADPGQPLHWLRLDRSDGMPTRECIGGGQPAGWKGDDGRLWFPTGNGIVRVSPERVEINRVPPPVYLRGSRINGHPQEPQDGALETGPGRCRLEFRFIGLSYSAPEKVTYHARLTGLEETWHDLGSQRTAAFEAVPPGSYVFEVIAVNGDGVPSDQPARIAVHIAPHFWQARWFIATLGSVTLLAAVGIGWGVGRLRLKRRLHHLGIHHAREAERTRIARDLHDDLGASLTEISLLSALAAEGEDPEVLRPALDQLSGKAKAAVGALDEIVWAVNPREDLLSSLIDYLAAFAREFLAAAGIPLRTEIPATIPEWHLEATVRHGVFLAAREALNNLARHSQATRALLVVTLGEASLEIRIEDNGRGFTPEEEEDKGYGIENLRERMRACGGDCSITAAPGSGVCVSLTLPLLAAPAAPR